MEKHFFYRVLFAQLLVILIVVLLFSTLSPRVAGLIAAGFFCVLAFGTIMSSRRPPRRGFTFFASILFLAGAVLPILLIRLLNWDTEFKNAELLGIPGPVFHAVSGYLYLAMVLGSIGDIIRVGKIKKAA